ncbi:hypothetical protein SADUNF_Sadunf18G0085700 [Salix dunnii]|uniref:Uncharacterized protein n=1 Tax=Salix dunnii TaxID=1413687 RepID=A0A835J8I5_9ROSI|nr:hypothetical protein SADUNF_Sadunf18G0085700 [Salix dunnii]
MECAYHTKATVSPTVSVAPLFNAPLTHGSELSPGGFYFRIKYPFQLITAGGVGGGDDAPGNDKAYILLYVDGIILTASLAALRQSIMSKLGFEFAMKDLGPLSYFLGISTIRHLGGNPYHDPTECHSLAEALQYLTFTRPDISYVVQQICLFMHDPGTQHMSALNCIIRYIKDSMYNNIRFEYSGVLEYEILSFLG